MDKGCLEEAFDCMDHEILLKKMFLYGFKEHTIKYFKSYFTN